MWMMLAAIQAAVMPLPAGVDDDVTCLAALMALSASKTPEQREGLELGMMYFIGRIDRAAPDLNFLARVRVMLKNDDARVKAAQPRCFKQLASRAELLHSTGAMPAR